MSFRRPESMRERTLLRIIERQQQTIADLNDRLMFLAGRPWEQPPAAQHDVDVREPEPVLWTATPEQDAKY